MTMRGSIDVDSVMCGAASACTVYRGTREQLLKLGLIPSDLFRRAKPAEGCSFQGQYFELLPLGSQLWELRFWHERFEEPEDDEAIMANLGQSPQMTQDLKELGKILESYRRHGYLELSERVRLEQLTGRLHSAG
ncbi:hypothetical protein CKO35_16855 [Ectothiorhodospira shaposhnikovii]|nr:hypothetical protein [Ectothiorhodospira shaposhnikovii]